MRRAASGLQAISHLEGRRLDLAWQNPAAADFSGGAPLAGVRIVRRERTYARDPDDGHLIYDGPPITRFTDRGLRPLTTYFYTVYTRDGAAQFYVSDGARATGFATEDYRLTERWYRLLPAVHQRYDLPPSPAELAQMDPAVVAALGGLPAPLRERGALRRFFQGLAGPLDLMRSFAEGLPQLRHLDRMPPGFLPMAAEWIGWEPDRTLPVFAQRNELRFAPHLYRTVGTVPNLRTLVTRYTGWYAQVAEFTERLARSNTAAQLNVFARIETSGGWRGTDDAAPVLGFGPGNAAAAGAGGLPAILPGNVAEPFALRPGMVLTVTADERIPVTVRFQPDDFASIAAATAAEVADVLNRTLSEVTATALATGQIELRSHLTGPTSSLRVEQHDTSLLTLEGAPRGRLATCTDATQRLRLFYETADPLEPLVHAAAAATLAAEGPAVSPIPSAAPPAGNRRGSRGHLSAGAAGPDPVQDFPRRRLGRSAAAPAGYGGSAGGPGGDGAGGRTDLARLGAGSGHRDLEHPLRARRGEERAPG